MALFKFGVIQMLDNNLKIFTIGHSSLKIDDFLNLLDLFDITKVIDVRSSPFSRRYPHYNKNELDFSLSSYNIEYDYAGNALGGRPNSNELFLNGIANYEKMASTSIYQGGIRHAIKCAETQNAVLVCSEKHPLECHRCLLVGRTLKERGLHVENILHDGSSLSQDDIENILIRNSRLSKDMLSSDDDVRSDAYRVQSRKIAYSSPSGDRKIYKQVKAVVDV